MNNSKVPPDLIIPPVSFLNSPEKMIFSSKKETFVTSSSLAFHKNDEKAKPKPSNQVTF